MHLSGFEIGEEIGGGGHRFYRARRIRDGRPVLLRASSNSARSSAHAKLLLKRELEICFDIDVDGVLAALDLIDDGDAAVLVLADTPGLSLGRILGRGEPLLLAAALDIGAQLAKILGALHRRDLVHRDLRPANIFYDSASGEVSLTGLGRASRVPREAWRIRAPDRLEGDPIYLAPEATGRVNRQLDYRADLYSLGVVLFELLTGRRPFEDSDAGALVYAHIALEPPDPRVLVPDLPPELSAIVGKLLAKAAADRYQSSLGLGYDLKLCLAALTAGDASAGELSRGEARPFVPGKRDVAERFELPQTLLGRESELRWLEDALATTAAGRPVVRMVAGYSGVGKTALIEEVRFSVLRSRGLFASGTFDPNSSATPYAGILNALRGLVLQQLGARPERVRAWRRRLEEDLGTSLGMMTEALPELRTLAGKPPPVPKVVEPENAKNRFHLCVARFLATLTTADSHEGSGNPVVLFLDDLHWIDSASLELLANVLTGADGAFLLLGAYRDHRVDEDHPLTGRVAELAAKGVDIDTLRLSPLTETAVSRLVVETLHLPPEEAAPLAELVYRKTAGNPFFARTFLSTLYQSRLLRFTDSELPNDDGSPAGPRWVWDLEAIAALESTENVVELVSHQLTELPSTSRHALAVASVLGKEVDSETLATVSGSDRETEELLIEACRQGLMVKAGASSWGVQGEETQRYAFVHDRVREGAYALLQAEERADVHLRIGRLLRDRVGESPRDLFEIADHLNRAAHLITDPAERRELVQLNAEAGQRARASGAFPAASAYLHHALEIVDDKEAGADFDPWQDCYELTRSLHAEAAEAASLAGDFAAAEQLAEILSDHARTLLDAVPAYEVRIYVLYARRDEEAAIRLALDVLSWFGVEIPMQPEASELEAVVAVADAAVEQVLETVAKHGVAALPILRDPARLAVLRLLARTVLIAGWHRIRLLRLATCRLVELTATHGVSPTSPLAYNLMAEVRCGQLQDIPGGRRVGELGLELARHLNASGLEATCEILFEVLVGGRIVHPAVLQERFVEHFRHSLETGDSLLVGACGVQRAIAGLLAGSELSEVEASIRADYAKVHGLGQLMMAHSIERVGRLVGVLRGQGAVVQAVDTTDVAPGAVASVRTRVIGPELMTRFLLRQRLPALRAARESVAMPNGAVPLFPFDFYRCLIFLDTDSEDLRAEDASECDACQARLELQARAAPEIYQHKLDLVKAHRQRAGGAVAEALALYERAIEGARRNDFPHEEALARELAAELCLEMAGHRPTAAAYLREAVAAYGKWGARAKVDQLFERYPDLVSMSDDSEASAASLDVTSLERAQSVLAGELDLGRLLHRLMTLLLENAGARRGFLLRDDRLKDKRDQIVIEARGTEGEVHLPEDLTLDDCDEIAASVVRFVARTRETVTLGEAGRDPRFAQDPYIERQRPCSILCFPLLHRGQAEEIVYLENERSPNVFSPERRAAVRLLASHVVTALQNARLHHGLKQEVETRRRAEADLAALKDRLEAENVYLQEEIQSHFEEIVGDSEAMRKVLYKVEQVAATDATVLILGETGTGKELIARALHRLSPRRERPLVKVNCAALPTTLIESELFGHEKGAFTGALSRKVGRFELADSGTLFLDEIGDLPLELQAKLLRVLQEGEFERLGGVKTIKVDVRIIAATNRDLEKAMAEGTFRSDLYYRLTVFPIELPSLKERHGDVPLLVHFFVDRKQGRLGRAVEKIPQEVMARLVGYAWPGNVRELENVVERALILSPGDTLRLEESFGASKTGNPSSERLVDLERAHIRGVLEACEWKVKGEGNAAERLGLTPPTLRNRMKKLGIVRPA